MHEQYYGECVETTHGQDCSSWIGNRPAKNYELRVATDLVMLAALIVGTIVYVWRRTRAPQ